MKAKQMQRMKAVGLEGQSSVKLEAGKIYDAEGVEDRPEFIFKNGAKYVG